ncbi:MAG: hypothetical protein B6D58_07640 [candidate division Zixibacteria bacterium 4484_95]|nr:MAG: hypothetical protein B6D58_07640 [candidate division Zixibacteria bacterium 4484_95]
MRRYSWMVVLVFLLSSINVVAQDPGEPDTVFVQSDIYVDYNPGEWTYVYVDIDFSLDNVIGFLNIPLTWNSSDGNIWPDSVIWRDWFIYWITYDTILFEEQLIRIVAWFDIGGHPVYCERVNVIDLRFLISPYAEEQYVLIDTTFDPRHGSLIFGDTLGEVEYTPIFYSGGFTYGEPTGTDENDLPIPKSYNLYQNHPNPFNTNTLIRYDLPQDCFVRIEVYDILGQRVRTLVKDFQQAGAYNVVWDGKTESGDNVPSGIYFYRLISDFYEDAKKMVLVR